VEDESARDNESDRDLAAALHEVGNGLTVILGWLEEAHAHAGSEGPVAEAVAIALARARRAQRLARVAIGAAVTEGKPSVEPLASIMDECIQGLSPIAAKKHVDMRAALAPECRAIQVEAGDRLLQVVTNLLLNAIEVTKEGGRVQVAVRAGAEPGTLSVRVADEGPGIGPLDRARLFQRGVSGKKGGAGIGLSHALRIATEEGGKLAAEPWVEGQGAVFELVWPTTAMSSRAGPRTRRAALLKDTRVAVVDDDAGVTDLLDMVLSARGATVTSFSKHKEFLSTLATNAYDVALLDASPFGDRLLETLDNLKREHPALDLILISGSSDPGVDVGRLGVTWIRKPFEVEEVIDVVRVVRASSRSDT